MIAAPSTKRPKPAQRSISQPSAQEMGFLQELRALLLPEKKWHYVFHAVVILVALSYWVVSLWTLPEASPAEIVMYRPQGDNQVYPVITALSRLNFGDPTDALNYGKGVAGFHAVILFPYAMAYAVFGWAGYMLADAGFSWAYLLATALLLRRCNLGMAASLVLGSALATGSLQAVFSELNIVLGKLVTIFGGEASEWAFPNLLGLQLFSKRIPRPMITEVLVVLLLYMLLGLWRAPNLPTRGMGVALGVCMSLLMQGDPYSFSTLGLVVLAVAGRSMAVNGWRWPWPFLLGAGISSLVVSSYFIFQMFAQHPDGAARFGLFSYGRSRLMFLPGYGALLRVAVVAAIAGLIWYVVRRQQRDSLEPGGNSETVRASETGSEKAAGLAHGQIAQFCVVMVVAAWLAQPAQVFLLGKGAQLYHYLIATLPAFYSYALVILGCHVLLMATGPSRNAFRQNPSTARLGTVLLMALLLTGEFLLGIESSLDSAYTKMTARDEVSPWAQMGDKYRPSFRDLDKAFRENPRLKASRTFATFSHEVNFLLTAFHDKRAYLPDNGFTTLPDKDLERRLFEVSKICRLDPGQFGNLIQNMQVMNYWLGCAKYWFAVGQTFSPLSEYPEPEIAKLKLLGRQPVFSLVLPKNELDRLTKEYSECVVEASDVNHYPDAIIMSTILTQQGVIPNNFLYQVTHTNEVFFVYTKTQTVGTYSGAAP